MESLRYELTLYFTVIIAGILLMVGGISCYCTKKAVEVRMSESTVGTLKFLAAFRNFPSLSYQIRISGSMQK